MTPPHDANRHDEDVKPGRRWWANWRQRHQHPASFALHIIGIPLTIAAVVLAGAQLASWRWDLWWRPALLLAIGYVLQLVGHLIEGNDMGEIILIKKALERPYTGISPRYLKDDTTTSATSRATADPGVNRLDDSSGKESHS